MRNLTVAEFHNTHCVCRSPLIGDGVFRDPEIAFAEKSPDIKARWLARMVTAQSLQIGAPEDPLTRLRIIADGIFVVNIVFRVCIAGCGRLPVLIQRFTYLFFPHDHLPCGIKPGLAGFTTLLNLCLVRIRLISSIVSSGASLGRAEILKFSHARAAVRGVVSKAVPRWTAQGNNTWAGVFPTRPAIAETTGSSSGPGLVP